MQSRRWYDRSPSSLRADTLARARPRASRCRLWPGAPAGARWRRVGVSSRQHASPSASEAATVPPSRPAALPAVRPGWCRVRRLDHATPTFHRLAELQLAYTQPLIRQPALRITRLYRRYLEHPAGVNEIGILNLILVCLVDFAPLTTASVKALCDFPQTVPLLYCVCGRYGTRISPLLAAGRADRALDRCRSSTDLLDDQRAPLGELQRVPNVAVAAPVSDLKI